MSHCCVPEILRTRKGIAEIILRATVGVLAVLLIITATIAQNEIRLFTGAEILNKMYAAAVWILVPASACLLAAVVTVPLRLLNLGIINSHTRPLAAIDAVICLVVALGLFAGATPMAIYYKDVKTHFINTENTEIIANSAGATTVFGYFLLFFLLLLGVWDVVAFCVLKVSAASQYQSMEGDPGNPEAFPETSKESKPV